MRQTGNPLQQALEVLFGHLNALNGLLHLLDNQVSQGVKLVRQVLENKRFDVSRLPFGTSLVVSDLTEWPEHGWRVKYASGGFSAYGEEYFAAAGTLVARESAWTVSQGYEAFETYLFDMAAAFLHANQDKADLQRAIAFESKGKSGSTGRREIEYWRRFSRWAYRGKNNQEVLDLLRSLAPLMAEAEKENNRGLDLSKWYTAASEVRHAATHSNLVIQTPPGHSAIEDEATYFPCKQAGGSRALDLKVENAENALRLFAEYGFLVFKCLSQAWDYDWQIFDKK